MITTALMSVMILASVSVVRAEVVGAVQDGVEQAACSTCTSTCSTCSKCSTCCSSCSKCPTCCSCRSEGLVEQERSVVEVSSGTEEELCPCKLVCTHCNNKCTQCSCDPYCTACCKRAEDLTTAAVIAAVVE